MRFRVQGEKGEPGQVIGPDGNLVHLEGLTGPKVSPTASDCVHLLYVSLSLVKRGTRLSSRVYALWFLHVFGDPFVVVTDQFPLNCL